MSKYKSRSGGRAVVALIVILLILAILALPWVYLQFASFPWDDYKTLAAENEHPYDFADLSADNVLTVRLTKADLYSLLLEYYPPEELLKNAGLTSLVRVELEELGLSIQPNEARLSLRLRALGFLHLPAQLRCRVEEAGDGLLVTPETVYIGPLLHISAEKLAQRVGQPELAQPYLLSPKDHGAEGVTLRAGEDEVTLSAAVPELLPYMMDLNVTRLTLSLMLAGVEDLPPAAAAASGEGFAAAFRTAIREGTAWELLTSYLALGEEAVYQLLEEYAGEIPAGFLPDPAEVAAQRQAALDLLEQAQNGA